jgi:hypothetical protein
MNCQFCKNNFSTTTSLNHHQKNAKYCLKIRGECGKSKHTCNGCSKTFSRIYEYKRHMNICKADTIVEEYKLQLFDITKDSNSKMNKICLLEIIINDQKQTIKDLQDKLENIAIKAVQRSTTVNKTQINNIIQKMEPVTVTHLIDHAPNLTLEHVQKGASGYAEYALEYPLKARIACVDYARRKIKFKDNDGNVITDPEMAKLAPMFFESIKNKSSELVYGLNNVNSDMDSSMFEQVAKLFNTNADVKNGSTGIKSEFFHDFVKHVCSGSVVEN